VVIEKAKLRNEISIDLEPGIVFDMMSGIMLYGLIFQPTTESWQSYVRRALGCLLKAENDTK
jgi:hypothetical protein